MPFELDLLQPDADAVADSDAVGLTAACRRRFPRGLAGWLSTAMQICRSYPRQRLYVVVGEQKKGIGREAKGTRWSRGMRVVRFRRAF